MDRAYGDSNKWGEVADIERLKGLCELWGETTGDPRICIAVLDGPVDLSHPSLLDADLVQGVTLASGAVESGPSLAHGTHVASILFGRQDGPVKGVSPRCRGLLVPIFQDTKDGETRPCSEVDLARAILQASQHGAQIINISGGQFSSSGEAHPLLADAVRECIDGGILVVAAAGNRGCDCFDVPGALPSVLVVGAMDFDGHPLDFSNWGYKYQSQGVLAPGDRIIGASPGGGVARMSGTSVAAPIVSGVAALLLSLQLKLDKVPNPQVVREAILRSAFGCDYQKTSDRRRLLGGCLNVEGAVERIRSQGEVMVEMVKYQSDPSNRFEEHQHQSLASGVQGVPVGEQRSSRGAEESGNLSIIQSSATMPEQNDSIVPSTCGCSGAGGVTSVASIQLVYALGQLGFDFRMEARRDSFIQSMNEPGTGIPPNPYDPQQLIRYLQENPWDAASLTWILSIETTPVYAILPSGSFASAAYDRLRQFLGEQLVEGVERVSIPGVVAGSVRLMNGQVVPAIMPELRGMYSWSTAELVKKLVGDEPVDPANGTAYQEKVVRVNSFLDRVYYELRNLGQTPQQRAINFAATNAFNIEKVYEQSVKEDMDLDTIEVERSLVCRPESDCWDVKLLFFFPDRQVQTVRKVYRFTVDVSDVVPVTVGAVRSWFVR